MKCMLVKLLVALLFVSVSDLTVSLQAKEAPRLKKTSTTEQYANSVPQPTLSEIAYGDHARHVLDFWKAASDKPTPLVFVIHGSAWRNGSKERLNRFVDHDRGFHRGMKDRTKDFATATDRSYPLSKEKYPPVSAKHPDGISYPYDQVTESALKFMEASKEGPFYLNLWHWMVHWPVLTRNGDLLEYYCDRMGYPSPPESGDMTRAGQQNPYFGAMVTSVDWSLGRVVDYLKNTDLVNEPEYAPVVQRLAAHLNASLEANNARGPYLNPDYSNKKATSAAIVESTFRQSECQARLRIDPNGPAVREAYVMYRCKPGSLEKKPEARGGQKMDKDAALYDVKLPAVISADGTVVSAHIPDGIPAYCFILIDAHHFQTYSDVEVTNSGL